MTEIINLLPEETASLFSFDKPSTNYSFITSDMSEYLKEEFFISKDSSTNPIYILTNYANRTRKTLVAESLKILLNIKSKGFKDVDFYIFSDNKIELLKDFIVDSPIDTEGFFPDLEYLSNHINENEDTNYTRSLKVKVFAQFIKFALKDKELESLLTAII